MNTGRAVLEAHAHRLEHLGARHFAHGSLALGGYHHGISDVDLCVLLDHALTAREDQDVAASHQLAGPLLSAAYVLDPADPEQSHPTWTHGWSGTRRVSLITRAELHAAHPGDWPEIPDLPGVVAAEVTRAWSRELTAPGTWLKTECVDLALTSVVRALITQDTGQLTGKDEAVAQLEARGVPHTLAVAVRERRHGREALPHNRIARAVQTRGVVKRLLNQL
jgi:hypothetical protein